MEQLPLYIKLVFILTTLLALLLLYRATNRSKPLLVIIVLWLALQAIMSLRGFYTAGSGTQPRFALLLFPPVLLIISLFLTKKGKKFIDGFDLKAATLLHTIRIPVELTLYWLFLYKAVPGIMTFEGRNFDILAGLSAPFIYYFGYVKNVLGRKFLLVWNSICLLLLANIVVTAILSAPSSFQQFAFDQPNRAIFYFPFVWLPSCLVPVVLLAHLAAIRKLLIQGDPKQAPNRLSF